MFGEGETLLEARGVGKIYSRQQAAMRARLGRVMSVSAFGGRVDKLSEAGPRDFWAVKDIDLTVKRGEAVGIIGLNGSGKTTLLRMLAGQILPDAGVIRVSGRSASMIDLTAGFEMLETGRRNIYFRGAALGRSKAELDAALDEIIAFSELGDAIDAPVATYSSGMTMRLAFSIMVASVPDVLFIDEVLAVGDFRFRQKCLAKIREIRERTSFVMVSHSMADIRAFCDQVIVLNKGREVFCGAPDEAVEVYENLQFEGDNPREEKQKAVLAPQFENREILTDVEHYWCDEEGRQVETVRTGDPLWFHLSFVASHVPRKLTIGIPVWTDEGVNTTGFSSAIQEDHFVAGEGERVVFRLHIPQFVLNPGIYISNISVVDGPEFLYRNANPKLEVTARHHTSWGIVGMPYQWRQLP